MDELIRTAYIRGPLGPRGPQGPVGPKGEQGPIGLKGDKGDMGPMGPRGFQGPKGDPFTYEDFTEDQLEGLRGPQGIQGEQDPQGIQGIQGEKGDKGDQGIQGEKGDPFTYENFTAAQLEALRGPQGPLGILGIQGEQGPAGQDGSDGADGQDGAPGQDGHSPVVTASKSGSTTTIYVDGTSIATIEDGLDGQDGQNGTNGTNGTDGLDGVTPHIDSTTGNWFVGTTDTGVHAQGPAGLDGSNGTNGSDGQDGHTPVITASKSNGVTTVSVDGEAIATINDGQDGSDGTNGTNGTDGNDGTDGITPTVTVTSISNGHNVAFSYGTGDSRNTDFNVMDGNVANQLQADWNLSDNTQADYIKNKPAIPSAPDLTNYIQKSSTSGLIKNDGTVDTNTYLTSHLSLTNYVLKSLTSGLLKNDGTVDTSTHVKTPTFDANSHDYIDLGLPSGTLWATMNVGASVATDYGNYYMYGKGSTLYNSSDSSYTGNENPLDLSVDTARQVWGGDWHMPTYEQCLELLHNTTITRTEINGIEGLKFKGLNNNYIFFPGAGDYLNGTLENTPHDFFIWTSSINSSNNLPYFFGIDSNGASYLSGGIRYEGLSIRPVIDNPYIISKVAVTGSYSDLTDKPTIPVIWRGTQAQYDLLTPDDNTIYIITSAS